MRRVLFRVTTLYVRFSMTCSAIISAFVDFRYRYGRNVGRVQRSSFASKYGFATFRPRFSCVYCYLKILELLLNLPSSLPSIVLAWKVWSSGPIPCCRAENCPYRLVLPHIINGAIFSSAFSTGNSLVFSASRVLHGLAVRGQMPRFLTYCTKDGLPLYAVIVSVSALTITLGFHVPQHFNRVASHFSLSWTYFQGPRQLSSLLKSFCSFICLLNYFITAGLWTWQLQRASLVGFR